MTPQERMQQTMERAKAGKALKLSVGENIIRILPNKLGRKDHLCYAEIMVHRDVGPKNGFVTCGKDPDGIGACWLCDSKIPNLRNSASADNRKKAEKMLPKLQLVFQASEVIKGRFGLAKPLYQSGAQSGLGMTILGVLSKERNAYLTHPIQGRNMIIDRVGLGKNDTKYNFSGLEDEPSAVPKEVFESIKPFSEILKPYDIERQKATWEGRRMDDDDEDGDREESRGDRRSRSMGEREEAARGSADTGDDTGDYYTEGAPEGGDAPFEDPDPVDGAEGPVPEADADGGYYEEPADGEPVPEAEETYYEEPGAEGAEAPEGEENYYTDPEPEPEPVAPPPPAPVRRAPPAPQAAPAPRAAATVPAPRTAAPAPRTAAPPAPRQAAPPPAAQRPPAPPAPRTAPPAPRTAPPPARTAPPSAQAAPPAVAGRAVTKRAGPPPPKKA